ncbi:MAG: DUF167 family protein [Alphaproteobacteria bacterium]
MIEKSPPLVQKKGEVFLHIRLTPNGNSDEFLGIDKDEYGQEFLKIKVRAIPEKGKANKALIAFIAKECHMAKSLILVASGETQRRKILKIDLPFNEAKSKLKDILDIKG